MSNIVGAPGSLPEYDAQPLREQIPLVEIPELQEAHVETAKSEHGLERILVAEDDPDLGCCE